MSAKCFVNNCIIFKRHRLVLIKDPFVREAKQWDEWPSKWNPMLFHVILNSELMYWSYMNQFNGFSHAWIGYWNNSQQILNACLWFVRLKVSHVEVEWVVGCHLLKLVVNQQNVPPYSHALFPKFLSLGLRSICQQTKLWPLGVTSLGVRFVSCQRLVIIWINLI